MAKKDRDIEKGYSNDQIVEKLRRLADCIESGKNFYVPARAEFTIEHEREDGDEELEFQFKWKA